MPAARSRDLTLAIASIGAVAVTAIAAGLLVPPQERFPQGSSYSTAPDGSAAAYRTLEALGYRVRRSIDPMTAIPDTPGSTLLVYAEPIEAASEQDRRAVRAYVAKGGTVLVTGCAGISFFVRNASGDGSPVGDARPYQAAILSPLTIGAPSITIASGCGGADLGSEFSPLYLAGGIAGAVYGHIGAGTAMWWTSATPLTNAAIRDEHNFALLLNAAGAPGRTVIWDEYYHGQRRSLWSYTAGTPLRWGLAQVVLVLAIAAAAYARRRVPVRRRYVDPRTSPLEFVETMASLYGRAPSAAAAVAVAHARFRRLLLAVTGQTTGAGDETLAAAAASRLGVSSDDLTALLESARGAASDSSTTADTALPLVRRIQTLAAEIRTGG